MKSDDSHLPLYRVPGAYELQLESDFAEVRDDFIAKKATDRGYYDSE